MQKFILKIKNYFLPLSVNMLEANIFPYSFNSCKNHNVSCSSTRLLSHSNFNHSLLSFADFNEVLK